MTRDDFEDWLEEHKDLALEHIEGDNRPVEAWVRLFGKALAFLLTEEEPEDDDEAYEGLFD
jgi:hypothetical protein